MDALAAAGWAWSAPGQYTTVRSGRGWLGVVTAWQAHLSGRLGAMGRCASTSWHSSKQCLQQLFESSNIGCQTGKLR